MPNSTIPQIATTQNLPYTTDFLEVGRTGTSTKLPATLLPFKVPTTAAMTALSVSGIADKAMLLIANGTAVGDFTGIFTYNAASALAANGTTIFAPDVGSGRWLQVLGATGAFDPAGSAAAAQAAAIAASLQKAANLSDVASTITSKNNLNFRVINVRDYGAVGNGTNDDTTAIQAAANAVTNNSSLYFPAGVYKITAAFGFSSTTLTNVTIYGDGFCSQILNDSGPTGSNTCVIQWGCSRFNIYGLFWNGTASVRDQGVHIRLQAGQSRVHHCYFSGSSGFALQVTGENNGYIGTVIVTDNFFGATLGDGVHVGSAADVLVANNICFNTGDDSLAAVADYTAYPPARVTFIGNRIYNAGSSGVSGCGIRVCEGSDILIEGNDIVNSIEAGIRVTRNNSTTAYSYNVMIVGNKMRSTGSNGGQRGALWVEWCSGLTIRGNTIDQPISGNGICFLDCNAMTISGNYIVNQIVRAIATDDSTTTNVGNTWDRIFITHNEFNYSPYEAIYIQPPSGKTVANLLIAGNNSQQAAALGGSAYIFVNQLGGTCKIMNNISLEGKSASSFGGSGSTPNYANNN